MRARRVLVDSAVFLYAIGTDHELKPACRRVLADTDLELCASTELVQEVVFHRMRMGDRAAAVATARQVGRACRLYPFDQHVLDLALTLIERQGVGGRDAVHAATALLHGIPEIVSPDTDFDGIEGLIRLDPRELA